MTGGTTGGTSDLTSLGTSTGSSLAKGSNSLLGSSSGGTSLKNLFSSGTDTMNSSMLTALLRILAQKGATA